MLNGFMKNLIIYFLLVCYRVLQLVYSHMSESRSSYDLALINYEHESVKQFNSQEEENAYKLRIGRAKADVGNFLMLKY